MTVVQTALRNHPGMWLNSDAAASLDRYEADNGRVNLTDAGRTVATQQHLIDRWNQGGAGNRPPYLYKPYMPAAQGPHVGGEAIDTDQVAHFAATSASYGWVHNLPSNDPVHFIYVAANDQHRNRPAGGVPAANTATTQRQSWLNAHRGEHLAVDGVEGPATKDAYKRYQGFLRQFGYAGAIDGIWGAGTQTAHAKYFAQVDAASHAQPVSAQQVIKNEQTWLNKSRGEHLAVDGVIGANTLAAFKRYQQFLHAYGYAGAIDGIWGAGTQAAHAKYFATFK